MSDAMLVGGYVAAFALGALWAGPALYHHRLKRTMRRVLARRLEGDELRAELQKWNRCSR